MNEKQTFLLQNLKQIKDYWTNASVDSLNPNSDLIWSENEEEYKLLQTKIKSPEELNAYRKTQNEIIKGVIHSILVMIDGGDELADTYLLDLIDKETQTSLLTDVSLHEESYGYLLDNEDDE